MTTYNFVPKRNRKYGWIPDRPDPRDKIFAAAPKIKIPDEVTLKTLCSEVEDQGRLSSCVGNACAGMLECLENKGAARVTITKGPSLCDQLLSAFGIKPNKYGTEYFGFMDVSRLFIYYNARARDGLERQDQGASIRSALKSLNALGYCWEKDWVYDYGKVNVRPPSSCYQDARNRTITEYMSLSTVDDMIICLAEGYPFVIGISIYESFEGDAARRTGVINMPQKNEASLGGHAVLVIGYNKNTSRFLVRNSWGPLWGQDGYCTIPFEYIKIYGMDAWTIRK